MTFWWKCNDGGSTPPTGPDFNSDLVENLVGLWEFSSGGETKDTGLSDGIAQNGHFHGNAHAANGALQLDGNCDYFDVSGTDAPFDLSEGTVQVQFIQDHQVGTSPDTIVNRGEFCDKDTEGYFNIQVTANGAVTVSHFSGSDSLSLSTGAGFFDAGDELRVSYSWDDDGQGSFVVENLSEGTTYETDFDSAGLNMDIGDNDDENFTFGAREYDDGTYDQYFDGSIAYVAVFSDPSITTGSDGIVEGTDGDDIIDATYEGDPDGDMIDAGDALLAGEVGDDDIIYAGAGDDTILAGAGNDEIYGQGGDDTIDAGTGDDVIYGDASSGPTKVFTGDHVRESFEWNEAGVANDQALTDFSQDTGNVNVSFKVLQQDTDATTQFSSDQQKVHSIDTDGPGADAHSSLDSNLNGHGNEATYELSFSDAVNDVSFRVNDIDGDGLVKVTAYDAAGNEINVDMTGGSHLKLKDTDGQFGVDTADSNGGYEEDTSPNYSLLVDIPGPVARIVIEHDQDGSNNSGINITDVYYDAPVFIEGEADDCVDAGDDVISAGDGADLVFGNGGDDTIDGGAGNDTLYGDGQNDGQSSGGNVADSLSLNANNVQHGSQTGHDGSAGAGDSVIYNNVAVTEDGTVVMAKLVVVDVDSGLKVDLTGGLGSEILLNGDNDNSDAGKDATFRLEFYDQATGEPIALTSVATFGDLDLTNTAEKVTISTDTFSNYGTSADTSLNVTTGAGTVTATGTEENDPTDQDAWFSAGFENETAIEFTLTTRDVNSGFTLNGQLIDAPVVVEICEPGDDIITGGEGDDVIYGDDGTFGQLSADNLIVNGSFEDTSGMTQTGYGYTDTGAVNGWTSSNPTTNDIDFHNDGRGDVDPTDGNNWLDLEGNPGPLRIGQDVNGVQDGEEYVLTFDAADAVGGDNGIKVFWNGELIDTIDPNEGDMTTYTYTVVGGSGDGSDRLEFEGTGQADYVGASIDNVSLVGYDTNDGEGGDDIITGGSGSDTMYGEGGNDTFIVDTPSDADGDVIVGGNGPDESDDWDVLDLRGAGRVTINETDDETDDGATKGTVTFDDGSTLEFSQIEEILTDPQNEAPVANDDTATVLEDGSVNIPVLDNDSDPDGDPLTVTEATSPNGTVTINPDGTLTFVPDENFNGATTITYTVTDPDGNEDTATVDVNVTPVNDAPDAVDDSDTTLEDTSITVDLLGNDTDVDGDDLTVVEATVPADQGTLVNNGDGTVTFTPAPDFNGEATITYTIEDEEGLQDTATHTIDVTPDGDAPLAEDDTATVLEDGSVDIPVLDNDSDPDGDPLTVTEATSPNGTVTINPDGTLTFVPDENFNGATTITYTVTDPDGNEDTATVDVTVTPVNDAPDAVDDTAETEFNAPVIIDVLGNDTDVDGDDLTVIAATSPDGTVEINPDGTLTFTPTDGFTGEATIDYTIEDEDGLQDTAQVSVTVGDQPRDGIVEGTSGDDLIDLAYTGDPDGDMVDNNDELLAGEGPNDDIIFGYDGDDTIFGGEGDDEIDGGTGDDTIFGEDGDDVIVDEQGSDTVDGGDGDDEIDVAGGDSPDTIAELLGLTNPNNLADLDYSPYSEVVPVDSDPNDDIDTVIGGAGDDTIITGDDADYIEGGDGNDTIYSGIDDDTVFGGDGDDYIEDVQGADYVDGGAGDDTIIVGFDTFSDYSNGGLSDDPKLPSAGYPFLEDQNQIDGKDEVHGGDGDDYIVTGDDADLIYGDDGDDTIKAGIDDDTVYGGTGNDNILGGHGSDYIEGGDGDDYIDASDLFQIMNHTNEDDATDPFPNNDMDVVYGGAGNDTIIGGDDQDMLYGEAGNDIIDGGIDDDTIDGGAGNDILMGGDGDDTITAGEGFDTVSGGTGSDSIYGGGDNDVLSGGDDNDFIYISESQSGLNNTTVNGGAGGLDWDTLDISDMLSNGWVITAQVQNPDSDGNGFDGTIELYNADDDTYANINYTNIEQVIPCFTPGTMIATPEGERAVESLKVGDKVITRDNGMQTIRWVGAKEMTTDELTKRAELKPILIREGALGQGLPERDMIVSPNHRMLVTSEKAALLFEDYEVLVAAKHLLGRAGVEELDAQDVTYIHIMFDRHEVILSDGTWSESFQPGDYTLAGIGEESRTEIFTLFPELRDIATRDDYMTARRVLRKHEAALLVN